MKYFYSQIIEIEPIVTRMEELKLTDEQKLHLAGLIDSIIHQTVLDLVLSKLDEKNKIIFMEILKEDQNGEQTLEFLNTRAENITEQIRETVKMLQEEFFQDLIEAGRIN